MRLPVRVFRLAPSLGAVALSVQLDAAYLSGLDPRILLAPDPSDWLCSSYTRLGEFLT